MQRANWNWSAAAALLVCTASCTSKISIEAVELVFEDAKLLHIWIAADEDTMDKISKVDAMYVKLFPCGNESESISYPIVDREPYGTPVSGRLLVPVRPFYPQLAARPDSLCVRLSAKGMSFSHYRSNVVVPVTTIQGGGGD